MKLNALLASLRSVAFILVAFASSSYAADLLTIDISNPAAVVITATGNFSSINEATITQGKGVDLLGFYQLVPVSTFANITGSLKPSGGLSINPYDVYNVDNYSGTRIDLNLLTFQGSTQVFSISNAAFTGASTLDLRNSTPNSLPTVGATGNILDGNSTSSGGIIGTWSVVPEPSTNALIGLGAITLLISSCARIRKQTA